MTGKGSAFAVSITTLRDCFKLLGDVVGELSRTDCQSVHGITIHDVSRFPGTDWQSVLLKPISS
jgi:hypothetical protein